MNVHLRRSALIARKKTGQIRGPAQRGRWAQDLAGRSRLRNRFRSWIRGSSSSRRLSKSELKSSFEGWRMLESSQAPGRVYYSNPIFIIIISAPPAAFARTSWLLVVKYLCVRNVSFFRDTVRATAGTALGRELLLDFKLPNLTRSTTILLV